MIKFAPTTLDMCFHLSIPSLVATNLVFSSSSTYQTQLWKALIVKSTSKKQRLKLYSIDFQLYVMGFGYFYDEMVDLDFFFFGLYIIFNNSNPMKI